MGPEGLSLTLTTGGRLLVLEAFSLVKWAEPLGRWL